MPPKKKVSKTKKAPKNVAHEKAQLAMALYNSLKTADAPKESPQESNLVFLDTTASRKGPRKAVHQPLILLTSNETRLEIWTKRLQSILDYEPYQYDESSAAFADEFKDYKLWLEDKLEENAEILLIASNLSTWFERKRPSFLTQQAANDTEGTDQMTQTQLGEVLETLFVNNFI